MSLCGRNLLDLLSAETLYSVRRDQIHPILKTKVPVINSAGIRTILSNIVKKVWRNRSVGRYCTFVVRSYPIRIGCSCEATGLQMSAKCLFKIKQASCAVLRLYFHLGGTGKAMLASVVYVLFV